MVLQIVCCVKPDLDFFSENTAGGTKQIEQFFCCGKFPTIWYHFCWGFDSDNPRKPKITELKNSSVQTCSNFSPVQVEGEKICHTHGKVHIIRKKKMYICWYPPSLLRGEKFSRWKANKLLIFLPLNLSISSKYQSTDISVEQLLDRAVEGKFAHCVLCTTLINLFSSLLLKFCQGRKDSNKPFVVCLIRSD